MNASVSESGNGEKNLSDFSVLQHSRGTDNGTMSLRKVQIPPEVVRLIPSEFIQRHRVLPLEVRNGTLHVLSADPGNQRVIDDIRLLSGYEVVESSAPSSDLIEKIAECCQIGRASCRERVCHGV